MSTETTNAFPLAKQIGFVAGPVLFGLMLLIGAPKGLEAGPWEVMAVAAWMLAWWVSGATPIPVTAILPIVLFPLTGVMEIGQATSPYASPIVFLFMGGFMIALGLERHNLHRRIALNIINWTGTDARRLVLGFMLATAFLSMWLSNTATTVMMLPIAISVVDLLIPPGEPGAGKRRGTFAISLMLAIAYSANIGGTATIIGTPPNTVLVGYLEEFHQIEIAFTDWMLVGIPFAAIMLFLTFITLTWLLFPSGKQKLGDNQNIIKEQLKALGPMRLPELLVLLIFVMTALAWILRPTINKWLPEPGISDAGIAMAGGVLMFVTPLSFKRGKFLLDWEDTTRLPWGILLLFGGGLSMAGAMKQTGIIEMLGNAVEGGQFDAWLVILLFTLIVIYMTELMSNVALVTIFLPALSGIAVGLDMELMPLLVPVTLGASCAFMLPMATPPNAIVFASGHLEIPHMVRAGFLLNLFGLILITLFAQTLIPWVLV